MNCLKTKGVFVLTGVVLVVGMAGWAWAQNGAGGPAPQKAVDQFKNIKVLKDLPADQINPTMQFFSASLGVECDYCHEKEKEKDGKKEKGTARKMLEMVAAANASTFDGHREVTCYSCHRGYPNPVSIPLIAGQSPPPEPAPEELKEARPAAKPTGLPGVDEIFDKYLAATGGASTAQKVSSRVVKGTVTDFGGRQFPMEIFAKAPDARLTVLHLAKGDNVTSHNGGAGWNRAGAGEARNMAAAAIDAARLEDPLYFAGRMKQVFSELTVDHTEKVGGREAYVVYGRTQALPRVKLYFDKESGMLVRLLHYTETASGFIPTQIDYVDYRNVGGAKIPYRWAIAQIKGVRSTYQIDQMQQNVPIEEAKFAKPSEPAASKQNSVAR